ncbi:MAG: glycosyl transferase family 1, partial [Dehalococcoidia bacterium]|nr:glycosyl transferase family 1 [Dehalococcoidia bacterium]
TAETGMIVPPSDPAALAAGLTTLLKDPERLRALGRVAHQRAQEFSLPRFSERVVVVVRDRWA